MSCNIAVYFDVITCIGTIILVIETTLVTKMKTEVSRNQSLDCYFMENTNKTQILNH